MISFFRTEKLFKTNRKGRTIKMLKKGLYGFCGIILAAMLSVCAFAQDGCVVEPATEADKGGEYGSAYEAAGYKATLTYRDKTE